MDLGIRGKVALVTASSKGLGRAAAEALAAEGVDLALCARTPGPLEETARAIRERHGVQVFAVTGDVATDAGRTIAVEMALGKYKRIDILVANAGGPPAGGFADFGLDAYRAALELNLLSAVDLARRVAPGMAERGWGRIVHVASIAVKQPIPGLILSNTARAALVGFAKTLATELGPRGVLVHTACPGTIFTDRIKALAQVETADAVRPGTPIGDLVARVPLGRMGRPEEFGAAVAFLCSERASYLTGTTIQVDGGAFQGLM
jgi:3-oxoacyl-[acyl-carrier protein] reductase